MKRQMKRDLALLAGLFLASIAIVPALAAGEFIVGQKDKQFSAETLTVPNGTKVKFVNDDTVAHNITVRDPNGAVKPGATQKPGDQTEVAFDRKGVHEVRCGIHPKMKMTVKVD